MAQTFQLIHTDDQDLNRIQANISNALNPILSASGVSVTSTNNIPTTTKKPIATPFSAGVLVTTILTSGVDNLIPHGLGRVPTVWIICGQDTGTLVWSPKTSKLSNQSSNANYINLQCGASCNVSIWVA